MREKAKALVKIDKIYGIGTYWYFEFFESINIEEVKDNIELVIKQFENNYSRFIDISFISLLNTNRYIDNPPKELIEILKLGVEYYNNSDHIFNIGIGEVLENNGYDKYYSFKRKEENINIPNLDSLISFSDKEIFLTSNGNIDLGGFGKGYLIDKLCQMFLYKLHIDYFLINGGGDIYVTSDWGQPVELVLQHPKDLKLFIGSVRAMNQSLCSSTPYKRQWIDKETHIIYTHIVNTQNTILFSTFILTPKVVVADFLATAMMMSNVNTTNKLMNLYGMEYLVVNERGEIFHSSKFNLRT